jgi:phosphomannomutase/phosphoglucomutase
MDHVFREYDIRGLAEKDLTNTFAVSLGRVLGKIAKQKFKEDFFWVGQDVRLSSPRLATAIATGIKSVGVEPLVLGPGPTPLLYFSAHQALPEMPTKSGVMITGSHNPPEYNGFKIVVGGTTLFGSEIQDLKELVGSEMKNAEGFLNTISSSQFKKMDRSADYIQFLRNHLKVKKRLKVVLDGGNGAGGDLGLKTYQALGVEVVPLFCDPDGTFPNHHPDPTVPKNLVHLQKKVLETNSDFGIGFDGDADRIGVVSGSGKILYGDHLVLYFARDILKEVPGATIISEVKSSQVLYDMLGRWGANPILWKTGHSLIKAKLKETNAAMAGEMSGHMFFAHRYLGFDDAIYAGARLIEGFSQRSESLDDFLKSLPPMMNTPEIRVDCDDSKKFRIVQQFTSAAKSLYQNRVNDIDGARIQMNGGWGLLRASNTQPVLVMRFEAPNASELKNIRDQFSSLLQKIDPEIFVPEIEV